MPISIYCLSFAWLSISWLPLPETSAVPGFPSSISVADSAESFHDKLTSLYCSLDLDKKGLSQQAFDYACKGYEKLLRKKLIASSSYLVICDFSQSSNNKRLYLIDLLNGGVLLNTYVAHGRNSGGEYARHFSNKPSSRQSSLGFYITKDTYYGEHGLSLRVNGLEPGFNDKALQRHIVVHGADYIEDRWLQKGGMCMGRSYGCPAVPDNQSAYLINTIKNGSCLFIYHPSKYYLKGSKILNG